MTLQSMTGFAREVGSSGGLSVAWEVRSVNGKALEIRFRLPPGHERIEVAARPLVQKRFARGSIQATLTVSGLSALVAPPTVNEAFLIDLAGLSRRLAEQYGLAPATADGLLALRGVLEASETMADAATLAAFDAEALRVLDGALAALEEARLAEGRAIGTILSGQIDAIENLVARADADPSRDPSAIRQRLADQVALLMEPSAGLDPARLHMEAAFLATRADIREEIDRLRTHVASARALTAQGGPVGRKLDFLAQEFNRESNTLCSKSNAGSVTAIGLELKAVVDQFREQIQNLE